MKNNFDPCLLRLKEQLQVHSNKDIAQLLGLTEKAFSARRTRGVFPDEKLWALAQKRPDLKLDVLAVFTGISTSGHAKLALHARADQMPSNEAVDLVSAKKSRSRKMDAVALTMPTAGTPDASTQMLISQAAKYVMVPRHDVRASAGGGSLIHDESVVDHLAFKRDWITKSLGCNPEQICVIEVRGDSMIPTLNDADLLLLDMRTVTQRVEGVYVIQLQGSLLVKRLRFKINGTVDVISDNKRYGTETLTSKEADQLTVLGRVVWHGCKF